MAGKLGGLEVDVSLGLARLREDVGKATQMVSGMASTFKAALGGIGAAFVVNEMRTFIAGVINSAAALDDMSERTGASVESLSRLSAVANIGGHSMETLEGGLVRLAKAIGSVDEKASPAKNALMNLGIDPKALKTTDTAEAFVMIAEKLNQYRDGLQKTAYLTELFGKSGAQLAPIIKDLADTKEKLRVITAEEAAEAEKLQKVWKSFNLVMVETKKSLVIDAIPALTELVSAVKEAYKESGLLYAMFIALGGAAANMFKQSDSAQLEALDKTITGIKSRLEQLNDAPGPYAKFNERQKAGLADALSTALAQRAEITRRMESRNAPQAPPDKLPNLPALRDFAKENKDAEAAAKALRDLQDAFSKIQLAKTKEDVARREQVLDAAYASYLIGEHEYWDTRGELQHEAFQKEIALAQEMVERHAAFLNQQPKNSKEYYDANKQLNESMAARAKLEADAGHAAKMNSLGATKAAEDYERMLGGIKAQLLSLRGEDEEAQRLRVQMSQREMRQRAVGNKDRQAVADLDEIERRSMAQFNFNQLKEKSDEINTRLAMSEQRVQDSLRTGAITEFEALRRTGTLRQEAADAMERYATAMRNVATAENNDKLGLLADQALESVRRLRVESNLLGEKIQSIFEDGFSDAFASFISGTKSAKEAFKDFAMSVISNLAKMQAQSMAKSIFNGISGSGGGLFEGLFDGIGSFFSGMFKAEGGPVAGGGSYIVGERGPELFTPGVSGNITPNGGAGGGSVVVHNHIDSRSDQATIAMATQRAVQQALSSLNNNLRRGGSFARQVGIA